MDSARAYSRNESYLGMLNGDEIKIDAKAVHVTRQVLRDGFRSRARQSLAPNTCQLDFCTLPSSSHRVRNAASIRSRPSLDSV
jgi:hypothetical protein